MQPVEWNHRGPAGHPRRNYPVRNASSVSSANPPYGRDRHPHPIPRRKRDPRSTSTLTPSRTRQTSAAMPPSTSGTPPSARRSSLRSTGTPAEIPSRPSSAAGRSSPRNTRNANPVCLFVYRTADGYSQTGAYNLDAPGFVQTSSASALELPCSVSQLRRSAARRARNLLPAHPEQPGGSTFNGSAAVKRSRILPGRHLRRRPDGCKRDQHRLRRRSGQTRTFWPPMGSGAFASAGLEHAAYFRNVFYYDPGRARAGSAQPRTGFSQLLHPQPRRRSRLPGTKTFTSAVPAATPAPEDSSKFRKIRPPRC